MNGYAIFINDDGTETKLNWGELKLEKNGKKYDYQADLIEDKKIQDNTFRGERIFPKARNSFPYYPSCSKLKEINIPEGIEYIGIAFNNCEQLERVTLPSTLKEIKGKAFSHTGIKEINIPEGVKYIEAETFYSCKQLEKVILHPTLKGIGENAFSCTGIKEIDIPEGVERVEEFAFCQCAQLEKVTLPSTLKKLEGSFTETAIKEIIIPSTIEYVDSGSFVWCNQLEKIFASRGLDINFPEEKVERTNEIFPPLQKFYNKCEENEIKLSKEEIDFLEKGGLHYEDSDYNNDGFINSLKLTDENNERLSLFDLIDFRDFEPKGYEKSIKRTVDWAKNIGIKDIKRNLRDLTIFRRNKIEPLPEELNDLQHSSEILMNYSSRFGSYGFDGDISFEDILNLKDSSGERCINVFELEEICDKNKFYREIEGSVYDYEGSEIEYTEDVIIINYPKIYNDVKQVIEMSEKLNIKIDFNNDPRELTQRYISSIEEKLQKYSSEFSNAKSKENERDNMPVHERD